MRSASRAAAAPPLPVVDQHRLAGRRDEQRGVAAFDVDDVDVEQLARLCVRRDKRSAETDEKREHEKAAMAHGVFLLGDLGGYLRQRSGYEV